MALTLAVVLALLREPAGYACPRCRCGAVTRRDLIVIPPGKYNSCFCACHAPPVLPTERCAGSVQRFYAERRL